MPNSKQIVYLSQAQYAELITNGSITVDGVTVTYDENDIYVTPQAEPVTDVRVNGTSILNNGVANIPIGNNKLGAVKIGATAYGLQIQNDGEVRVIRSSDADLKNGASGTVSLAPNTQHKSTFYGLAKAAGADMKDIANTTVGQYPDAQKAAIQHMLGTDTIIADNETDPFTNAHAIGELFTMNGKLYQVTAAISIGDAMTVGTNCAVVNIAGVFPHDVQVNGTSVVTSGVANVPKAANNVLGVVKTETNYGVMVNANGRIYVDGANSLVVKTATDQFRPVVPYNQHQSTFYGLAKAAGADMKDIASTTVGVYPEAQKSAISQMLNGPVTVTGSTPTITALPGIQYICGEVATLDIMLPASGCVDVVFESGSTPTVLTITPPTGQTIKWANGFDQTALEADTTYEINIADGLGVAASWT